MSESTSLSRRLFLGGVAATGAALALGGTALVLPAAAAPDGTQYGFWVNPRACMNCGRCVEACRDFNRLSPETANRRHITEVVKGQRRMTVSTACMHCGDPSCLAVCPAGAISKGAAGIVSVDKSRCIGCKYCYQACPYGVPSYNSEGMDKCDCCLGCGVAPGDEPYCVRACVFGALGYGPMQDLIQSDGAPGRKIAEANDPSCVMV